MKSPKRTYTKILVVFLTLLMASLALAACADNVDITNPFNPPASQPTAAPATIVPNQTNPPLPTSSLPPTTADATTAPATTAVPTTVVATAVAPKPTRDPGKPIGSDEAQKMIAARAKETIAAIKNKDYAKLSSLVHPDKGVLFAPYAFIGGKEVVLTASQVKGLASNTTKYTWGRADGSGQPITLTWADYYKQFLYQRDFATAKEVGYNKVLREGNSINNINKVFPGNITVEYYFSGFDPQAQGYDWASLRLVFAEKNGTWYLVAAVRDQWTI